nr:PIN domain-containing protein [Isoptericola halotolerans]
MGRVTAIPGPVVADANILIALLDPTHVHHEAVQQALDHVIPVTSIDPTTHTQRPVIAYVHPLNMAEVLRGYTAASRQRVLELVESPQVGIVARPVEDRHEEVLSLARYAEHVKMPDACVLALAHHTRAAVLTLDKRLSNAAVTLDMDVVDMPLSTP